MGGTGSPGLRVDEIASKGRWLLMVELVGGTGVGVNGVGVDEGELWKRQMRTAASAGLFEFLDGFEAVANDPLA